VTLRVTSVAFSPARPLDVRDGLLGFASVHLDGVLAIHRVAVRRTLDGRVVLSFPAPADHDGRRRPLVHPLDAAAHAAIERQVVAELRRQGRIAS
jgi:DNA-binding cell septation regulator SpoVG